MSKYRIDGTQLALLSNSNTIRKVFNKVEYIIMVNDFVITAEFEVKNRGQLEIVKMCKMINRKTKAGIFRNNGMVVEYSDTIFVSNFHGFRLSTFIMNSIQKFEVNLKSYISVFQGMDIKRSINHSMIYRPPVYKKNEYKDSSSFKKDCDFILDIIKYKKIEINFLFSGGIKIKASNCIKYYTLPYFNARSVSLENRFARKQSKDYQDFKTKLYEADIEIIDERKFDLFTDIETKQMHLFPKNTLLEIFKFKPGTPLKQNTDLADIDEIIEKSFSFMKCELLFNCPFYKLVEIDSKDFEKSLKMFEDTKGIKSENIGIINQVFKRNPYNQNDHSGDISLYKYYIIFENFDNESLRNYFIGKLRSADYMELNKIIQVLLDFRLDISHGDKKYYYTISLNKLSFIDNNFRIFPGIIPQMDFSEVSPEELFVMVAYHNKSYFIVLRMLFQFNNFSNSIGKALKFEFKQPLRATKSKNTREILEGLCKKYEKNSELAEYAIEIDTYFNRIAEKIVNVLSPNFQPLNFTESENLYPEECQKVTHILILSIIFSKKKSIIEQLFNHLIKPFPKLVTKQPNPQYRNEVNEKPKLPKLKEFDIEEFINDSDIKTSVEEILIAQSKSNTWKFPEKFSPDYEKFKKLAETVQKRYCHEFLDAKDFGENLFSIKVKNLCEKEKITEKRSNIYLIGRVLYDTLFSERNKHLNQKLENARKDFCKYTKLVLRKRVCFKFSKSDEIDWSKYATICRTMMSYTISQRPTKESIERLLNLS